MHPVVGFVWQRLAFGGHGGGEGQFGLPLFAGRWTVVLGALSTGAGAAGTVVLGALTATHACVCTLITVPAGHCDGGAALATEDTMLAAIANAIDVKSPSPSRAPKNLGWMMMPEGLMGEFSSVVQLGTVNVWSPKSPRAVQRVEKGESGSIGWRRLHAALAEP